LVLLESITKRLVESVIGDDSEVVHSFIT
jgi:hypothetical protein